MSGERTRKPRRICIVRQQTFYELPVRREAEAFRDAGYNVDVILMSGSGDPGVETVDGVRLHMIAGSRERGGVARYLWDYARFLVLAGAHLTRLHLRRRYDVIQVNTMPDFLFLATLIPRLLGARITVFVKEPAPELGVTIYGTRRLSPLLEFFERAAVRYADVVFTVTEDLKALQVARGARADKIHVVLNGPQGDNLLHARRPDVGPDPDRFTLFIHGTIEDRYGHDTLVEAIAIARHEVPELRLRISGTGTNVARIHELIAELDLEDAVEYLGWLSLEDLVDELSAADVGVIAMKASPYSHVVHTNKMYEYILFGIPILASRLQSVSNYFDDSCVQYFEPDDPKSLAEGIVALRNDPERRRSLVWNARALYDAKYGWDIQEEILVNATEAILEP